MNLQEWAAAMTNLGIGEDLDLIRDSNIFSARTLPPFAGLASMQDARVIYVPGLIGDEHSERRGTFCAASHPFLCGFFNEFLTLMNELFRNQRFISPCPSYESLMTLDHTC